jgi:orotidine-5'-phosphate decarboxylase
MPLTEDMTELLGNIMSQVLSILALSTKAMMDKRISELDFSLFRSSMANYDAEKILKKLAGRTDVEDAVLQLDNLTKEESLMVVVRNLEVTHRVDGNVEATKVLTGDIGDNVRVIDRKLNTTNDGA